MGENADLVKAAWEAFRQGDIDGATSSTDHSAEITVPGTLPWGGTYTGPDGFKQMIGKLLAEFEELNPQPQAFLEADDGHVVVPVNAAGRTKAGNELSGRGLWLYQVRDGKLVRAEFFGDTARAREALGL
jgi:uncharacterized protein